MAREEHDREDLLATATALVERAELRISGETENVFAGFRRDGAASVYFGADPAYHFTSAGALRRAYCGGLLYKAERGKLVSLERRRTPQEVQLMRHELSPDETQAFLAEIARRLASFRSSLRADAWRLVGQSPASVDVVSRIRGWLEVLPLPPPIGHIR